MSLLRSSTTDGPLEVAAADEAKRVPVDREELVVIKAPKSQHAEQFRTLRNSIVALNPEGAPRTIVFTSALRHEGKTVSVLNLALALAELPGIQVAVIEANLHSPAVEKYLGLQRRQGLSELLSGRLPLDQALRSLSVNGVSILSAGSLPRNPSELLGSDRMRTLLRTLKQRFNYVLIDTPESSTTSDASLLGSMVDGIVLVVRRGQTPKNYVDSAHNSLETMGGNVVGICMTGTELENTAG